MKTDGFELCYNLPFLNSSFSPGIGTPTVKCSAGYFCLSGAKTVTPTQDGNANICPRGKFCLAGTDVPDPCPTVS